MTQTRSKVFVGNLLDSVKKDELKRHFGRFGQLRKVWLAHNPPGFAFIEFFNHNDAKNCVKNLDGKSFSGSKIRVEISYSDGPKPGNQVNMKGKILKGRPNGMNWNNDNMQMRRNRNNNVNGFGNQMRKRNFDNAFDDIGMNFRGNMNFRKRNGFHENGPVHRERMEQRGYKYGASDSQEFRKRNNSHPDNYRRRDAWNSRDLSDEPLKRPRSPESDDDRQVKYARYTIERYTIEQQNGHRNNHGIYPKDSCNGSNGTEKWNGVHNNNQSGNSVSSSDGGISINGSRESHSSSSPVERRRKHKRKEAEASSPIHRRRSPSPYDQSDSEADVSPVRRKKSRQKHHTNKRHESRASGSDRSYSGRPSSPEIASHKSRHRESSSSPEVRAKLLDLPGHGRKNGRKSRRGGATNGRRMRSRRDYSPQRRIEDLPRQYQPSNGGVNGYDHHSPEHNEQKNGRSQYETPSEDERVNWSNQVNESSPDRKATNHTRLYDLSPDRTKHVSKTKQCNSPVEKRNNDQGKQYESSPERISERNKRPRSKKR